PDDSFGDFLERLGPQSPAHAFVAAEQVADDRQGTALHVLEEDGRPAIGRFAHAVDDFSNFKERVDLSRNAHQFAAVLELIEKSGEMIVGHSSGRTAADTRGFPAVYDM